ncbi:GNAT superfamily N-acetyltransferase [Nocardia kruczakiae]|uniref:GNAT superfamily N-acetyltransferase n=1 Tax=Nocardia kruczakiae TaxID=261477 RepID=A0ABU1XNE3_9NOCA|nr:GNAT family N-acetyltransferase [Nocardia kruczakiae]MDR7172048.1 GNAT superfamily N-acetyltransferase [Nocardia kruczakiae]
MRIELTTDPFELHARAGHCLAREPLRHTVIATMVRNGVAGAMTIEPVFAMVCDGDAVVGVAIDTPGYGAYLGDMPAPALPGVAAALFDRDPAVVAVEGGPDSASEFALHWQRLSGNAFRLQWTTRLYRLGELRVPAVPGIARRAGESDTEVCVHLAERMRREEDIGPDPRTVPDRIAAGQWWLWEDAGVPVSVVAHQRRAYGWTRIGPVYTPPEFRRRGYAAAATAQVSKVLRDSGSHVCLFADLANPTSNKIYRDIGFEPVGDFPRFVFDPSQ